MVDVDVPSSHGFFEDLYLFVGHVMLPRLDGPDLGRWFERTVANYFKSDKLYDVLGITSDMNVMPISGVPHEFDLLIECGSHLFLFECKCTKNAKRNDLLLFNEKSFDYWLRLFEMDDTRRLFRVFVTKASPDDLTREYAYMWNIIIVEPDLMPVPQVFSLLSDIQVCQAVNIHRPADLTVILGKVCRSLDQLFLRSPINRRQLTLDLTDLVYDKNPKLDSATVRLFQRTLSNLFSKHLNAYNPTYMQQKSTDLEKKFGCTFV